MKSERQEPHHDLAAETRSPRRDGLGGIETSTMDRMGEAQFGQRGGRRTTAAELLSDVEVKGHLLFATEEGKAAWDDLCAGHRRTGEAGLDELMKSCETIIGVISLSPARWKGQSGETFCDVLYLAMRFGGPLTRSDRLFLAFCSRM